MHRHEVSSQATRARCVQRGNTLGNLVAGDRPKNVWAFARGLQSGGYISRNVERLRAPMQHITDTFLTLGGVRVTTKVVPICKPRFRESSKVIVTRNATRYSDK